MRKTELSCVTKALVELACASEAHTDEVLGLLGEKLTTLSLVIGIAVPVGPIVANPAAKGKSQNQQRLQPGNSHAPATKACDKFVKKTQQETKRKRRQ
jgi:hypothetical protein